MLLSLPVVVSSGGVGQSVGFVGRVFCDGLVGHVGRVGRVGASVGSGVSVGWVGGVCVGHVGRVFVGRVGTVGLVGSVSVGGRVGGCVGGRVGGRVGWVGGLVESLSHGSVPGARHNHGCTQTWWISLNLVPGAHGRCFHEPTAMHWKYRVGSARSGQSRANWSFVHAGGLPDVYPAIQNSVTITHMTIKI